MEVILIKDVEKLGKAGSLAKVKDGFARNYLFPRKLAMPVTEAGLKNLEEAKQKRLRQEEKARKDAELLKEKLAATSLTIAALAQDDESLFGGIMAQEICAALKDEGLEIDKSCIQLEEPIKALGIYEVPIKLLPEVLAKVKVWIVKK
jgi:large subunit ribosomal protein L9